MSKITFGKPCQYYPDIICELKTLTCQVCGFYTDYIKQQNELKKKEEGKPDGTI